MCNHHVYRYARLEGWSPLESIYFLTATATTVGYGDYAPTYDASRLVTVVYAPLGTLVVMSGLMPTHSALPTPCSSPRCAADSVCPVRCCTGRG